MLAREIMMQTNKAPTPSSDLMEPHQFLLLLSAIVQQQQNRKWIMIVLMHNKIVPMLKARKCETKSGIEKPPAVAAHELAKNGFKLAQKQRNKELQIS
jgi:hypothetical protein